MSEKEIGKMRGRFFSRFTKAEGKTTRWYEFTKDPLEVWGHMEKELKEAYYQGYMAGTMEAL